MKNGSMRSRRFTAMLAAMLAAMVCGAGVASGQPSGGGGGGGQLPPPVFEPALVFQVGTGNSYGLASADILDADGNPGQDGYPEIAVAGAGVDLFSENTFCTDAPSDHSIKIYHNKGATAAWDGSNPTDALEWKQTLPIGAAVPDMWAMELAFADITGINGPDLVLVGLDPDATGGNPRGYLLVYRNTGNGSFETTPFVTFSVTKEFRGLVTADLDHDNDIDVAVSLSNMRGEEWNCPPGEQDLVIVFENRTDPQNRIPLFNPVFVQLGIPDDSAPGDIVLGDFYVDGAGVPLFDLATPNPPAESVTLIENLGEMVYVSTTIDPAGCSGGWFYESATANQFGAGTDWDFAAAEPNDLFVDVFTGQSNGSFVSTCNDPYQLFIPPIGQEFKFHAHGIASGHIDNGPYPDLVVALWQDFVGVGEDDDVVEWNGAVAVLLGKSDGTFQMESDDPLEEAYIFRTDDPNDPNQPVVAKSANVMVVDLDADGFDDIIVANHSGDTLSVLINALEVSGIGGP